MQWIVCVTGLALVLPGTAMAAERGSYRSQAYVVAATFPDGISVGPVLFNDNGGPSKMGEVSIRGLVVVHGASTDAHGQQYASTQSRATVGAVTVMLRDGTRVLDLAGAEAACESLDEKWNEQLETLPPDGSTTFVGMAAVAPNTVRQVQGGNVTLNEQRVNDDETLTVNAIHLRLDDGTDLIVASATCGPRPIWI